METAGSDLKIAQRIGQILSEKKGENGTAASAAVIIDGELAAACCVGTQDGEESHPATAGDLYNVGSVSKVYCAMAVMKLVEAGKVTLDTPVCEYLPRFVMKDPRYTAITLRMCLNHSSGLPGTGGKNAFRTRWMDPSVFYDEYYDYLSKSKLKADPGAFSVYCNDGFTLAELVVAEVSGMSYTRFVQRYVTEPAGIVSACSGENNPASRTLIREKGKEPEYLMVVGAGGIASDMADCARFGYLFIDAKDVCTADSIREISARQGVTFLKDNFATLYGLGWDLVDFMDEKYDFGGSVLLKSGGTASFSTYLIVIKKYNLSAAMSATHDTKIDVLAALCELCCAALEERGIVTRKDQLVVRQPVPEEIRHRYSGVYLNATMALRIDIGADSMTVSQITSEGSTEILKDVPYDGTRFISGTPPFNAPFSFDEYDGQIYAVMEAAIGRNPIAQKMPDYPPLSGGWKKRVGKSYILTDGSPDDIAVRTGGCGITVAELEGSGLVFFESRLLDTAAFSPALPAGDDDTDMFLNAPGSTGSRDAFATWAFVKDGVEYLYDRGFTYIDTDALPELKKGAVKSERAQENKAFRISAGKKLSVTGADGAAVFMLDSKMVPRYNSLTDTEMPETVDGYLLFVNSGPMDAAVDFE